ncbi:uncharacterized protein KD926_008808 [Aspergillus affinis]|uniref:uncharacterized protein n=1 Tax=Aspergillus affinis TaxID=1070780 RepID=UPI0022FF142B|nr:uncharacterized protein KD926_008808 [Aspergillus affinis]KAI9045381.1 hypothetical protein KD926_008808 [Aspergillus affinis]
MALPLQELISPPQEEIPTAEGYITATERDIATRGRDSRQLHARIVSVAAKALVEKNIPFVEYGEQIQWRYGYPVVLARVEWAIPNELFSLASKIPSEQGFPAVPTSSGAAFWYGEWDRTCTTHSLGESCPVYLYPLSLVGLELQDTCKVTSTFDRTLKILTPKPTKCMVSLLRLLLNYPLGDISRRRVKIDLLAFICGYVLREKPLNTKEGVYDNGESDEEYQNKAGEALREMETWDWDAGRKDYLSIAETMMRDARVIDQLTSC